MITNAIEAMSEINESDRELLISARTDDSNNVVVTFRDTGRDSIRTALTACSMRFTPPSPKAWAWGWPFAILLLRRTEAGCGRAPMILAGPSFSSACRLRRRAWIGRNRSLQRLRLEFDIEQGAPGALIIVTEATARPRGFETFAFLTAHRECWSVRRLSRIVRRSAI